MTKISVIGAGKLGCPVALAMESKGHQVVVYDPSPKVQEIIRSKILPYKEIGAQKLLTKSKIGCVSLEDALVFADIVFVAVQTPHQPMYEGITRVPEITADFDYSYLQNSIKEISAILDRRKMDKIIIIISTVLPTTIENKIMPLMSKHIKLCYNPFFIAMSTTIPNFLNPEFILFGVHDKYAAQKAEEFYKTITDAKLYKCTIREAECVKIFYNTLISSKIVFTNIIMESCDKIGANVDVVMNALKLADKRIVSTAYMNGGMCDQGFCHPRDLIALSHFAKEKNLTYNIFNDLAKARDHQMDWFATLIKEQLDEVEKSDCVLPVVILGKAYKPETNLVAGSGGILLQNILKEDGIYAKMYDPYIDLNEKELYKDITKHAHLYFIGTKHKEFEHFPFPKGSIIIDPFRYIPNTRDDIHVIRIGESQE